MVYDTYRCTCKKTEGPDIETILKAKGQPPFKRLDIVIYALLLTLIAALFWVFVIGRPAVRLETLEVWHDERSGGEVPVFRYRFSDGSYEIDPAWADRVAVTDGEGAFQVTFDGFDGGEGFNTLVIARSGEAYMQDANCSRRKDCTHFVHITHGNQMIVCVPHRLTVTGVGPSDAPVTDTDVDIIIG